MQAAATETAAARHAKERQEFVKRATKAEDRCKNTVVTDVWEVDRVEEIMAKNHTRVHRVSLSQVKGEKQTVTIGVLFLSNEYVEFSVSSDLHYPSVSVLLHNTRAMDGPLELTKWPQLVHKSNLCKKYLTTDGSLTRTIKLHGT